MLVRKENILVQKSEAFTDRIIRMSAYLRHKGADNNILKQIFRSRTSIGANVCESKYAQSRADFVHKLSIALKEANETDYWLRKLYTAKSLTDTEYNSMNNDAEEIIKILVAIINTTKRNGL
ncbi:MAG: four helix bundle protein [Prevotella sp.]|nr:four helix bundle protein [Prevotella sp.]